MEILKCEEVTKIYGTGGSKVTALDHVNLTVEKGEFTAIIGASGSGKSTLLHLIGCVENPTAGKIIVEQADITTLNKTGAALYRRRKIGLIYQFFNLVPTLSVRKNILLPLLLDRQKPDPEYLEQLIHTLGLKDKLDAMPDQLSGGEQQRTAIARSLLYRPAILLADEPTGNLDQENSKEIIKLLKSSNRNYNQTILLVTHDEKIALEADRIITMEDGRIKSDADTGNLV